jgi:cytidyltransferase-like protein
VRLFEKIYLRLLSESKKKYAGSHPDESYREWHDLETDWFNKKGLTTSSKNRKTTKNYFKDMGLLEESIEDEPIIANIGLVPMSAKPFHKGHMALVNQALQECDQVILFISTSDRDKGGDFKILGQDMEFIWKNIIKKYLPENVECIYGGSPVRNVYKEIEDNMHLDNKYNIYSGKEDAGRYNPKYFKDTIHPVDVVLLERGVDTAGISGTAMRQFLQNGMKEEFMTGLPEEIENISDREEIYNILKKDL